MFSTGQHQASTGQQQASTGQKSQKIQLDQKDKIDRCFINP